MVERRSSRELFPSLSEGMGVLCGDSSNELGGYDPGGDFVWYRSVDVREREKSSVEQALICNAG